MKITSALLLSLTLASAFALDKYTETMKKTIDMLYQSESREQYQQVINTFERIGESEKDKWEPFYYAAFGNVLLATKESDPSKKDVLLDLAEASIQKAKAIEQKESEIIAMEGFIYMIRLTVDPASRGQKFSGLAMKSFNTAVKMNPQNPRALCLLGQMQLGMAQFFGSSNEEGCASVQQSLQLFESFTSENELAPRWGKETALETLKACK